MSKAKGNRSRPITTFYAPHSLEALQSLLNPEYSYGNWRCTYRFYPVNPFGKYHDAICRVQAVCRTIPIFSYGQGFTVYLYATVLESNCTQIEVRISSNRILESIIWIMTILVIAILILFLSKLPMVVAVITMLLVCFQAVMLIYERYYLRKKFLKALQNHLS